MRKVIRKVLTGVVASAMTVAMCATCFAGTTFEGYFGAAEGWYEGADGSLTNATATGYDADMVTIGWGGIWGAQAYKDITVKKGKKYTLSFDISSTNIEKWVFVKIAEPQDDTAIVYGDWIKLTPGTTTKYKASFKASASAESIYFGLGGEMGDRTEEEGAIYSLSEELPNDYDSSMSTTVKLTNFSFKVCKANIKATKDKKKNSVALYNYLKKNGKIFKVVNDTLCTIQLSGNKIEMKAVMDGKKLVDVKFAKNKPNVKKIRGSVSVAINTALKSETNLTLKKLK